MLPHLGFALQGEFPQASPAELPGELGPEVLVAFLARLAACPVEDPKGVLDRRLDMSSAQGFARARALARE